MPVAKKHKHWCPTCLRELTCRAFAVCGGKDSPRDEPCWPCTQEQQKEKESQSQDEEEKRVL